MSNILQLRNTDLNGTTDVPPKSFSLKKNVLLDDEKEYEMSVNVDLDDGTIAGTDLSKLLFVKNYVLPILAKSEIHSELLEHIDMSIGRKHVCSI